MKFVTKGLLTIAGNVITNPMWSDAVATYLLNIR